MTPRFAIFYFLLSAFSALAADYVWVLQTSTNLTEWRNELLITNTEPMQAIRLQRFQTVTWNTVTNADFYEAYWTFKNTGGYVLTTGTNALVPSGVPVMVVSGLYTNGGSETSNPSVTITNLQGMN